MRNKIKQIIAVFFVMAATAVVWNAPVLAEASTQVELTGTQAVSYTQLVLWLRQRNISYFHVR